MAGEGCKRCGGRLPYQKLELCPACRRRVRDGARALMNVLEALALNEDLLEFVENIAHRNGIYTGEAASVTRPVAQNNVRALRKAGGR